MNRALPVIGGLILLLQAGLLGVGFARADDPQRIRAPIQPTVQPELPLDLEGILLFATGVAADWRSDSQLVKASLQIDWPHERSNESSLELPMGGWIFLAFLSHNDLLTMRIDRASGTVVQTGIIALDGGSRSAYADQVIDFSTATTSSATAIGAAEAAYGTTFRNACPDQRFTSWLTVQRLAESAVNSWHIEYKSVAESPQPSMAMDIDWQSGQIQNVTNADEPCA